MIVDKKVDVAVSMIVDDIVVDLIYGDVYVAKCYYRYNYNFV